LSFSIPELLPAWELVVSELWPLEFEIARVHTDLMPRNQNPQFQRLKLLGGDSLYSYETLSKGGEYLEGMVIAVPWFREAPALKDFAQKAKQQWGGEVSWRTATSYDATQALIKALSVNPSRATVLQQLRQINLPAQETSGEPLQFTSNGERQSEPILVKIEGGKFRLIP
jgi:ABC-type branched-subunit amino acid transport system substrate-binding protein